MPGIPTYERSVTPDSVGGPQASGNDGISRGLAVLGQGMQVVGNDYLAQQRQQDLINERAQKQQEEERAKAWAGQQSGQHLLDETGLMRDAQAAAAPGADGFTKTYLDGFDQRAAKIIETAPDDASKRYITQHIQAARLHLGTHAQAWQFQQGDADAANRYGSAVESWAKLVEQDPTQFDAAGKALAQTMPGFTPDKRVVHAEQTRKALTNAAAAHWLDADPYKVQEATGKAMGDKGYTGATGVPWVDQATPDQVRVWNNLADSKIKQIENAKGREADARDKQAQKTLASAKDLADKGQFFNDPFTVQLVADTKGTPYEDEARAVVESQRTTAGFASAPFAARDAALNAARSRAADPAVGTDPETAKDVAKLEAIHTAIGTAGDKNPWQAGVRYGAVRSAPLVPINGVDDAVKAVQARMPSIGSVESLLGHPVSPLQPEEAEQFGALVRKLPPAQAASAMGQIGAVVGDSTRAAQIAKQIGDKDGTLGIAMAYANTQTTEGRYASELVLTGEQMVKDGTLKASGNKIDDLKAQAATAVRGAYANRETEDQVIHAASLIAAAKGGDIDNAVRLATGGGIIDFNGSKVPMPVGYAAQGGQSGAEDKFRESIRKLPVEQLTVQLPDGKAYANGVPMAGSEFYKKLSEAQLVMAGRSRTGGNRYAVKAGNSLVTNRAGAPVLIELQ